MLYGAFKKCFRLWIFVIALMLAGVMSPPSANAQNDEYSCLDNIEEVLDGISSTSGTEFCENYREGWSFGLVPVSGHHGVATDGTILRLFSFRQPGWLRGQPNTIGFELVLHDPDIPNLFEIHIRDGEDIYDRAGKRTYFLWGRDVRTPLGNHGPYGSKWNPTRFIRCLTLAGYGCNTHYNVIICKDYRYPNLRQFEIDGSRYAPRISVSTQTPEASEDLLKNFDLAHNLVEEALERLLEHSCRQTR